MFAFFIAIMAALTAGGVFLTERVDRPRRRAEREQLAADRRRAAQAH